MRVEEKNYNSSKQYYDYSRKPVYKWANIYLYVRA